jgi:hypothetical protein
MIKSFIKVRSVSYKFKHTIKRIARPFVLSHRHLDGHDIRLPIPEPTGRSEEFLKDWKLREAEEDERVRGAIKERVDELLKPTGPGEGPLFLRGPVDSKVS